jgi:hypothetical protein
LRALLDSKYHPKASSEARSSEEIVFGDVSVFGSDVSESDLAVATNISEHFCGTLQRL